MNHLISNLITALNEIGGGFCSYAGSMFIQSGILIVLLLFVDFLIRKRVRATLRYWIWMLVFIKLILPPSLGLPTGLGYWRGDILTATPPALEETLTNTRPELSEPPLLIDETPLLFEIPQNQLPQTTAELTGSATPVISYMNTLTWQAVVFALWFVGVLVFSALLIQRILYVRRLIGRSEPAENRFAEMLNQCREPVSIRRPIELRLSNNVFSPAVCGFFKPVILMPTTLVEKLPPDRLRAVLIHELCHIKRGDLWINSAQTILQIIYFYNPLVWLANAVVRRIREQAVDEMVLVTLGTGAKDYSDTLIDIAEMVFFKTSLSLRLIGVVESKKALEGRIRHMLNRPIPKSVKLGILGLTTVLILAAVLLPMARAQKQSPDDTTPVLDLDKDGLENGLEAELGTNPKSSDTDADGLSDYDEYCKYRTDPTKKDSDGDGKPDGDWQERREYAYSIRAICEIRPPSSLEMINDLYQDARPVDKKATLNDARVVEVLIFPFAKAHVYSQSYPQKKLDRKLRKYVQPTASMNFSSQMKEEIAKILQGAATDVEAIEKMLQWMNAETSLVRRLPHWEYVNIIDGKIVWHKSFGSPAQDEQFLETNFLGDSMFKNKVHGTCSSTAILRGTMFRAAGLPTRLIQTLPLMTRYSEDPEPLADQLRMRAMAKGYDWGPGSGGANHTYNEVYLSNRWVRVNNSIGTGPFVGDKLFVKAWSAPSWNNLKEEWNDKRCFRALHVSDAYPEYKSEASDVDIAVEDKDLVVKKQPDGHFQAEIRIYNKGSVPSPKFGVYFYAGDPDEGGRLLARHGAGPIMPGGSWGEYNPRLKLESSEATISVVIDPDNRVEESDETNNRASRTISTTTQVRPAERAESARVDIAIGDKDFRVIKLSDRVFEVTIVLRNRGSVPIPRFRVNFCAGDPDEGGRLLSPQQAGPLMPGDIWAEYNPGLELRLGEDVISVIVDPDNRVEESDETNNKVLRSISTLGSESEDVDKVESIQKVDLSGDDILLVEAQTSEGFNYPYYLFVPSGTAKDRPVYMLVETNNSGMVSDDPEVHRAKALTLVERSHANEMAKRLGAPLLVPTFPRPRPETHSWAYTHALDIDTLEIEQGKLKRVDLQLTAMIKHAQKLLRINGFTINDRIFMHGFSASAKFCNRYSYLHPDMVKAAAAGGVNGLPTLPVREWNGYELPFPIGIAGIERFTGKPFDEQVFKQVAHYIYMGSSDRNDTLQPREASGAFEAWRKEEADIIWKALAAEKMMPDRWELSRKIYRQQKLPAQLVTYNGVGHSIKSQMLDDVIAFFKANAGEKYVPIKPYEYPLVKVEEVRPKERAGSAKIDIAIKDENLTVTEQPDGSFRAQIDIWNKGSHPFPKFRVNFYAGDPDEGGRLLAPHGAGPIKPGAGWGEYNPRLRLRPGENTISVVVDPDNKVAETDETNNKASRVIPGRQPKQSVEADTSDRQTTQAEVKMAAKEREKVARKASRMDIKPTHFDIRLDENRGTCDLVVYIQNNSNLTIPRFKLRFYRGDPGKNLDEAGNVQEGWHGAGPIEPGKGWGERTYGFHLPDGQYEFSVFLDCENDISEIDEDNNRAVLQVKIENGQIADKSVTCPSNSKDLKSDVQIDTERPDIRTEEGTKRRTVVLPDVDSKGLMLDLKSGELIEIPKSDNLDRIWSAILQLGKGDLVFDKSSLTLVRGATTQSPTETITGPFKAHQIEQKLPVSLTITTKEGISYAIKVRSVDNDGCRLEYYPLGKTDVKIEAQGTLITNKSPTKIPAEDLEVLTRRLAVLEHERERLAEKIKQCRKTIRELGDQYGELDLERRQEMMMSRVESLQKTLTAVEAERIQLEAEVRLLERIKEQPMSQEKLLQLRQAYVNGDPAVTACAEDIIELEREIIVAKQTKTATHPEIQRKNELLRKMQERLKELKEQANKTFDEMTKNEAAGAGNRLLNNKRSVLEQKKAFEKRLRETLAQQDMQTIEIGRKQQPIDDLNAELELAQKRYDLILTRIIEVKSEIPAAAPSNRSQNK